MLQENSKWIFSTGMENSVTKTMYSGSVHKGRRGKRRRRRSGIEKHFSKKVGKKTGLKKDVGGYRQQGGAS